MESKVETAKRIYSSFGGDADLGELVEMFVEEMPERIAALEQAFASDDWESLQRTAHQLKGAGGSYGFDQLTPYAKSLEFSVKDAEPSTTIEKHLNALIDICKKLRAGEPGLH